MKYLLLITFLFLSACGNTSTSTSTPQETEKKDAWPDKEDIKMRTDYPDIPLAEKGITMVNKQGWEESTLDFHLGYCQQMMASIADSVDTYVFCDCFISKIQYYYPPTFFKEAYEDQVIWNQYCYKTGYFAKKEFYQNQ